MMPPVCTICGRHLDPDDGGLVYFRRTESDYEWDRKMEENGMTGHPPYAEWFCSDHLRLALKFKDLTAGSALREIRSRL